MSRAGRAGPQHEAQEAAGAPGPGQAVGRCRRGAVRRPAVACGRRRGVKRNSVLDGPCVACRKPSARKKAKLAIQEGSGLPHGYHEGQRILLVGEGNFSFARALARLFSGNGENVTATSYDSREMAAAKYNVSVLSSGLDKCSLRRCGYS